MWKKMSNEQKIMYQELHDRDRNRFDCQRKYWKEAADALHNQKTNVTFAPKGSIALQLVESLPTCFTAAVVKEAESKSEILISNEVEKDPDEIKRQNSSDSGETAHDEHKEAETSAALGDKHSSEGAQLKTNLKNDCLRA
jgi:hypothetical protein